MGGKKPSNLLTIHTEQHNSHYDMLFCNWNIYYKIAQNNWFDKNSDITFHEYSSFRSIHESLSTLTCLPLDRTAVSKNFSQSLVQKIISDDKSMCARHSQILRMIHEIMGLVHVLWCTGIISVSKTNLQGLTCVETGDRQYLWMPLHLLSHLVMFPLQPK